MTIAAAFTTPDRMDFVFRFRDTADWRHPGYFYGMGKHYTVEQYLPIYLKGSYGQSCLYQVLQFTDDIEKDLANFKDLRVRWNGQDYPLMPDQFKDWPLENMIDLANELRAGLPKSWNIQPYPMPENLLSHAE